MNFAQCRHPRDHRGDRSRTALDRGLSVIRKNYENTAKRGRLTEEDVEKRMGLLNGSLDLERARRMRSRHRGRVREHGDQEGHLPQARTLIVKQGAILATNTSSLNIDEIATVTKRAEDRDRHALLLARQCDAAAGSRARATRRRSPSSPRRCSVARKIGKIARAGRRLPRLRRQPHARRSASARRRSWCSKARCRGTSTACSTISACRWGRSR